MPGKGIAKGLAGGKQQLLSAVRMRQATVRVWRGEVHFDWGGWERVFRQRWEWGVMRAQGRSRGQGSV
jgi:hypothetical protein